jgi:hypothetical protein
LVILGACSGPLNLVKLLKSVLGDDTFLVQLLLSLPFNCGEF